MLALFCFVKTHTAILLHPHADPGHSRHKFIDKLPLRNTNCLTCLVQAIRANLGQGELQQLLQETEAVLDDDAQVWLLLQCAAEDQAACPVHHLPCVLGQ